MMDRNYNMTLLAVLIGLAPACNIGDKNLGETDDGDSETTDPDSDSGPDLPGQEEQEEGETEGEPTTCGNGIEEANELCFELTELPVSGTALDVYIIDVDAGGENSLDDIVVLTNSPEAPLLIWHNDPDDDTQFETEPEIVAGQLPPATIPGLEIGDFDPLGIEYRDIAYASADGVVIGWDNGTGDENGFDELTLIECANPISFEVGGFDSADGADFLCAHEADGGGIEVLLASHLGGRSFAPPIPVASDLAALSPLRGAIDFSGATIRRRFIAHDRVDELIVWELAGDEYVSTSYSAPAVAWDLGLMYLTDGLELVVASHDPQGLLLIDETEGGFEAGELLATEALPYGVISYDVTNDLNRDLLVALGSGHLGVWRATDAGLADPVLIEIGPDPRRIAGGVIGWTEQPVIAVTTGETVSMLVPDP